MQRLIEGYRRFRETAYREHHALYEALVSQGQSPRAMIIGCSDSRVDPAILFGTEPGEVFVVRNVANLVPPYAQSGNYHGTSAALEFAVRSLQVEHVIVHDGDGLPRPGAYVQARRDDPRRTFDRPPQRQ